MPKPLPIPRSTREAVAEQIRAGLGRNQIARDFGISAGSVSNIARGLGHTFANASMTHAATRCGRIDAATWRLDRERELLTAQLTAMEQNRQRRADKIEKQIRDLERFHLPLEL